MMPTTVNAVPADPILITRPTKPFAAPKRLRQSRSLTTTAFTPSRPSAATNVRPTIGGTPRTSKNPAVTDWTNTVFGTSPVAASKGPGAVPAVAAIAVKAWFCSLQSRKLSGATRLRGNRGSRSQTMTNRPASGNGNGRISAASTRLNIEVVVLIPSASTTADASVNQGAFRN